jgi:putative membrane protein
MRNGMERSDCSIWMGLTAGAIGGLFGSWMMNQYQAAKEKVSESWEENNPRKSSSQQQQQSQGAESGSESEDEDATMKTAELISEKVLHRKLTHEEKKKAGPVVHYAYGAIVGGIYGAAAEIVPAVKKGGGTLYGSAVFLGGDEIGTWKLGLSQSPVMYPLSVHANALASHLVYGLSTELGRRVVRAIL